MGKKSGKVEDTKLVIHTEKDQYPDPLLPVSKKLELEYGYQFARAMYNSFNGGGNGTLLADKRERYKLSRAYRNGMQDMRQYLDMLKLDGDNTFTNLNISPVAVIPFFVDSMVEELAGVGWDVNVRSIDSLSTIEHQQAKEKLYADMMKRPKIQQLAASLGVQAQEQMGEVLESIDEIDVYLSMNYKTAVEMAAELGIELVFSENDYNEIRRQIIDDLITHDIASTYTSVSRTGVEIENIKPENVIYGYTERPDFKFMSRGAHLKVMTIAQLRRTCPDLTEPQLADIAKTFASSNNNPDRKANHGGFGSNGIDSQVYDSWQITVMPFEFLAEDLMVHEKTVKKGYSLLSREKEDYTVPATAKDKVKLEKTIQNVYHGIWVVDSEYVLNYGLKENIIRPQANLAKAKLGYQIYAPHIHKGEFKSIVERMRPFADQIQVNHIKIQQIIARAKPGGIAIPIEKIKEISLDGGNSQISPRQVLRMYAETGDLIMSGGDEYGDGYGRDMIKELGNGIDQHALSALANNYAFNLQMLRDVSGFIPERSGQTNPNQLVGVTENAIRSSLNSIGFIKNGWIRMAEMTAEYTLLALGDIIKFNPSIYEDKLSGTTLELLEGFADIPHRELGMEIRVEPDAAQRMVLEQAMQAEVNLGNLTSEIVHQIREVKNMSLAYQLIAMNRKRAQRAREKAAQANVQYQMEQQAAMVQAQQAAYKERVELDTAKELKVIKAKGDAEAYVESIKAELAKNSELAKIIIAKSEKEEDFGRAMVKEDFKENRKDARDEENRKFREKQANGKS